MPVNHKISLYLDPYINESGLQRVLIRVRADGWGESRKATDLFLSSTDFKDVNSDATTRKNRAIKSEILTVKQGVEDVLTQNPGISAKSLTAYFKTGVKLQDADRLESLFDVKIKELKEEREKTDRSNALSFYQKHKVLALAFFGNIAIYQITPQLLFEYERHILRRGRKPGEKDQSWNTVAAYMRTLCHLFHRAIKAKYVSADLFPFGSDEGKYQIPSENKTNDNLLSPGDVAKFLDYNPGVAEMRELVAKGELKTNSKRFTRALKLELYHDMWFLMYKFNGINPGDLLGIRWRDIYNTENGHEIRIYRKKTIRRRTNISELVIPCAADAWHIFMKHATKSLDPNSYVLPFFTQDMDVRKRELCKRAFCQKITRFCGLIAKDIGLRKFPASYTARHTFSQTVIQATGNLPLLSQMMGHAKEATTRAYLHKFESSIRKQAIDSLYKRSVAS